MRNPLWLKAVKQHLLPRLPGWRAAGWIVFPEPADGPLSRVVLTSIAKGGATFKVSAIVQLLAVPQDGWVGDCMRELGGYTHRLRSFESVEEAEPVMREIAELAEREAVPFFAEQATLPARLAYLHDRVARLDQRMGDGGWQDINIDEQLVYTHLLMGNIDQARVYAEWADRALPMRPIEWRVDVHARVTRVMEAAEVSIERALAILAEQEAYTRSKLKLPPPAVAPHT
jgi:hypothetical protein